MTSKNTEMKRWMVTIFQNDNGIPVSGGTAVIIGFVCIVLGELRETASSEKLKRLKKQLKNKYYLSTVNKT